jgi:uncharacterized protein YuzE
MAQKYRSTVTTLRLHVALLLCRTVRHFFCGLRYIQVVWPVATIELLEFLKNVMKVIYDPDKDILQISFSAATVEETTKITPELVLDYDKDGDLIGLEIRKASEKVENPYAIAYVVGAANMDKPRPKD